MERRLRYTSWVNIRHVTHSNKVDENIKPCPRKECQLTSTIVHAGSSPALTTKNKIMNEEDKIPQFEELAGVTLQTSDDFQGKMKIN